MASASVVTRLPTASCSPNQHYNVWQTQTNTDTRWGLYPLTMPWPCQKRDIAMSMQRTLYHSRATYHCSRSSPHVARLEPSWHSALNVPGTKRGQACPAVQYPVTHTYHHNKRFAVVYLWYSTSHISAGLQRCPTGLLMQYWFA